MLALTRDADLNGTLLYISSHPSLDIIVLPWSIFIHSFMFLPMRALSTFLFLPLPYAEKLLDSPPKMQHLLLRFNSASVWKNQKSHWSVHRTPCRDGLVVLPAGRKGKLSPTFQLSPVSITNHPQSIDSPRKPPPSISHTPCWATSTSPLILIRPMTGKSQIADYDLAGPTPSPLHAYSLYTGLRTAHALQTITLWWLLVGLCCGPESRTTRTISLLSIT